MNITETEEYKLARYTYMKNFHSMKDGNDPLFTPDWVYGAAGGGYYNGTKDTEIILTAQHDKEMEEFYNWLNLKRLESNGDLLTGENGYITGFKPFSEIRQLFRNSK